MIKVLFRLILMTILLFFMIGCNNVNLEEGHNSANADTIESVVESTSNIIEVSEPTKELTPMQKYLKKESELLNNKDLTEIERKILLRKYEDSIEQKKIEDHNRLRIEYTKKYGKKYTDEIFDEMEREKQQKKEREKAIENHYKRLYGKDWLGPYLNDSNNLRDWRDH